MKAFATAFLLLLASALAASDQPIIQWPPGVEPPRLIQNWAPEYTERARKAGVEGRVELSAVIGVNGRPRDIQVHCSLNPDLDHSAMKAVEKWVFEPATKNGRPVPVSAHIEMTFRLANSGGHLRKPHCEQPVARSFATGETWRGWDNTAKLAFLRGLNEGLFLLAAGTPNAAGHNPDDLSRTYDASYTAPYQLEELRSAINRFYSSKENAKTTVIEAYEKLRGKGGQRSHP